MPETGCLRAFRLNSTQLVDIYQSLRAFVHTSKVFHMAAIKASRKAALGTSQDHGAQSDALSTTRRLSFCVPFCAHPGCGLFHNVPHGNGVADFRSSFGLANAMHFFPPYQRHTHINVRRSFQVFDAVGCRMRRMQTTEYRAWEVAWLFFYAYGLVLASLAIVWPGGTNLVHRLTRCWYTGVWFHGVRAGNEKVLDVFFS